MLLYWGGGVGGTSVIFFGFVEGWCLGGGKKKGQNNSGVGEMGTEHNFLGNKTRGGGKLTKAGYLLLGIICYYFFVFLCYLFLFSVCTYPAVTQVPLCVVWPPLCASQASTSLRRVPTYLPSYSRGVQQLCIYLRHYAV